MDNISDPDITFDEKGICNYYYEYQKAAEQKLYKDPEEGRRELEKIVQKIKDAGKGKPYDCIMGLSGGVDSSYVAILAHEYGLRPLAVHFDNGWNSELAVKNIENIVNRLGFDLHTLVVDWKEFVDLQMAYLKASVVDIEVPTDHAITGTIARLCKKFNIKYSLSGTNIVTEYTMPPSWIFNKSDYINLVAIHKKFGKIPLKTYPLFSSYLKRYLKFKLGAESIQIINYVPYNKEKVKERITKELGWKDYGGKHFESLFTKFYQAYILPKKFGIDKRKAHLSTLIFSGQITKEKALEELDKPFYPEADFAHDYDFVLKKLNLKDSEFREIMALPRRSHFDFPVELSIYKKYPVLRPIGRLINNLRS